MASEIRPVFAEELALTGLEKRLTFDPAERRPLLWAKQNAYLYRGEEIARFSRTRYGRPLDIEWKVYCVGKLTHAIVRRLKDKWSWFRLMSERW